MRYSISPKTLSGLGKTLFLRQRADGSCVVSIPDDAGKLTDDYIWTPVFNPDALGVLLINQATNSFMQFSSPDDAIQSAAQTQESVEATGAPTCILQFEGVDKGAPQASNPLPGLGFPAGFPPKVGAGTAKADPAPAADGPRYVCVRVLSKPTCNLNVYGAGRPDQAEVVFVEAWGGGADNEIWTFNFIDCGAVDGG